LLFYDLVCKHYINNRINLAFYKFFGTDFTDALFFPYGRTAGEKIIQPPEAGRQGIGNMANPFHNSTVFIREIRAKKN
jgi:hypothetical protein